MCWVLERKQIIIKNKYYNTTEIGIVLAFIVFWRMFFGIDVYGVGVNCLVVHSLDVDDVDNVGINVLMCRLNSFSHYMLTTLVSLLALGCGVEPRLLYSNSTVDCAVLWEFFSW